MKNQYLKQDYGIIPKTIEKSVRKNISAIEVEDIEVEYKFENKEDIKQTISKLTEEMLKKETEK